MLLVASRYLEISRQRVQRLGQDLGLWLQARFGGQPPYDKNQIDEACRHHGYQDLDDLLVAYSLFGSNLVPDLALSAGLETAATDIEAEIAGLIDADDDAISTMADDELF